jgi:hypothetical protein
VTRETGHTAPDNGSARVLMRSAPNRRVPSVGFGETPACLAITISANAVSEAARAALQRAEHLRDRDRRERSRVAKPKAQVDEVPMKVVSRAGYASKLLPRRSSASLPSRLAG